MIIGADYYGSIILEGIKRGSGNEPLAQQTIFGWILSGSIDTGGSPAKGRILHCSTDDELQESLTRFWKQEETISLPGSNLTPDELACEQHFVNTHSRDQKGLKRRFSSDPLYKQRYEESLKDYLTLGHMVAAPISEDSTPAFYFPHHGVIREDRLTTKLRVVFNGSCRTSSGVSLNEILHSGAKLQTDISDVLLWIRTHRFIFSTDIVKMFRQIAVHPDDWALQSILWFNSEGQPAPHRLTTVTFGLTCAPFLALRTVLQLIEDEGARFPKAVPALKKGRYIDDTFGGADTISEAKEIVHQVTQLCMAGGFPLQKWKSNNQEILPPVSDSSNESSSESSSPVEFEPSLVKILGLIWNPETDTFLFSDKSSQRDRVTKRTILSEIAQMYDPLGFISPVMIRSKIILQELWLLKSGWDDSVPSELHDRWISFRLQLTTLQKLSIPRWLGLGSSKRIVELHGFSDASSMAMAAAVFVRVSQGNDEYLVRLVSAKTRVAPLKLLSIPRLELSAALLLSKLMTHIQKVLDLSDVPVHLWTDSSVTLYWITTHPSRWKDFVRNRVTAIQEMLPQGSWHFIPGKQNPADCASRGLTPEQLINHNLWWNGPSWLSEPSSLWPKAVSKLSPETDPEERPGMVSLTVSSPKPYWSLLDRYSSLSFLFRITALCRRVLSRLRKKPQTSLFWPLTPEEIHQSRNFWCKQVQHSWFANDLLIISKGDTFPRSHPMAKLTPFLDRDELIRVGGRLHYADLSMESKHPIILPRTSPLTTLIIDDAHSRTLHGGTQVTLSFIRQTYWIIGGRAPIRSFILKCIRCARYRGIRAQQLMGQLPMSRVTQARPFLHSGLDYAGPIILKTWRGRAARNYKGYLAIFVCQATSAIHIEIVTDYSTEAFIAAYKRFTARRGICATLQSDCGKNFVGADIALRQRFSIASKELRELASILAKDGTKWIFNPPSAPHFGGKWEAAVKSTKFHLTRVIGDTLLTYEELNTVIIQIEAVLNSRPLCPLSDDPSDYTALTPGHFLIGESLTTIPEPELSSESETRLNRWQLLRKKIDCFWKRWSVECLQRYLAVSKWYHPSNDIKEGSLVLMTDERYPPSKWPLGRVTKLHPGPDGLTRVVTLRTASSSFKRPIAKLCVLPFNPDESVRQLCRRRRAEMFRN
ncbi:uncharacterized protein LOC143908342 [Temnothorax americanus]|uniref:uncharacterized protein LOC143908342 n=1 Tax=Temnothorax americanus TaxID=1964332 RepID=UPI00406853D7